MATHIPATSDPPLREKSGALAGATGPDFKRGLFKKDNSTGTTEKKQAFYWSNGGSVERLGWREVAA